jgi:hypothetical protein
VENLMQLPKPGPQQPKPATILLAADQLVTLLSAQYGRLIELTESDSSENLQGIKLGATLKENGSGKLGDGDTRGVGSNSDETLLFHQAVLHVHTNVFENYKRCWCPLVGLRPIPQAIQDMQAHTPAGTWASTHSLISQLALYMLLVRGWDAVYDHTLCLERAYACKAWCLSCTVRCAVGRGCQPEAH